MKKDKKKEKVPFKRALKNNIYMLKIAYTSDRVMVIMRLVTGFLTGLNHGLSIFFISEILNALDRGQDIAYIFTLVGIMGLYTLAYELFYLIFNLILFSTLLTD